MYLYVNVLRTLKESEGKLVLPHLLDRIVINFLILFSDPSSNSNILVVLFTHSKVKSVVPMKMKVTMIKTKWWPIHL